MLNLSSSATRALLGRKDELLIRTQICTLQLTVLLVYGLELVISPHEDLLALIVKVGTLAYMLEDLQRVFSAFEHRPFWPVFTQFARAACLRESASGLVVRNGWQI